MCLSVPFVPRRQMDEEKAAVEELLRRGEELLQRAPDEGHREELRLELVRLQSQYSAHRVRGLSASCRRLVWCIFSSLVK